MNKVKLRGDEGMNKRVVSIIMIIFIFIMASVSPAYAANGLTTVTVTRPNDRAKDMEVMAIADGYVYYAGTNGRIMQSEVRPSNNADSDNGIIEPLTSKLVYQPLFR